ncbi:MAG: hypothetical protein LBS25_06135 [Candidatus Symbiothrix sp.]|jgi:hypothetical protein|nr:hypothetical protein [Candidatus Symbiothrix sp.]
MRTLKFFSFLFLAGLFAPAYAGTDDLLLYDFDNTVPGTVGSSTWPWVAWGGLSINDGKNDGTGAVSDPGFLGNKVAKVTYDGAGKTGAFLLPMPGTYNSNDFNGWSLNFKSADAAGLIFYFTIEDGSTYKGNWTFASLPAYTGGGAWQTLYFPLLEAQKNFIFDRICLSFTSHSTLGAFTGYMDDITLLRNATGIVDHTIDASEVWSNNGRLNARKLNGQTKVKVYTLTGQELYSTVADSEFSVSLNYQGLAFVALDNGSAVHIKKVILK